MKERKKQNLTFESDATLVLPALEDDALRDYIFRIVFSKEKES